jgi:GxxExxY protein
MVQSSAGKLERFSEHEYPLQELTGRIILAFFEVHRRFGFGFLESVYRRALAVELAHAGIPVAQEVPFELMYRGVSVGFYRADLIVASTVIVEAKTGLLLDPVAPAQLLNYLKAARLEVGLVLHFGPRTQIKRVIASRGRVETL